VFLKDSNAEEEEESDFVIEGKKIMKQKVQTTPIHQTLHEDSQRFLQLYESTVSPVDVQPYSYQQVTTEITNIDDEKIQEFQAGLQDLIEQATTTTEALKDETPTDNSSLHPYSVISKSRYIKFL
jgi:hypothetical protein